MTYFSGLWMLKYKKSQIAKGQYKDYLVGQLTRCTLYRFQLSKNVFFCCFFLWKHLLPRRSIWNIWIIQMWIECVCICSEVLDMTYVNMKLLVKFVFTASINDSMAEARLPLDFVLKPRWLWREKEIIGTGGYIGRRSPLFENDYNTSLSRPSAVSHTGSINGTIKPLSTLHWIKFFTV